MLIRIPPEQVMKYWPYIKECIAAALPSHIPESDETMVAIQERLLTGIFECWISCADKFGQVVYGVCVTRYVREEISGQKNLLIFSVTVIERHPENMWVECMDVLRKYAKAKGCSYIIAYSEVDKMIKIAESLGADTRTRLLYFKL